MSTFSPNKFFIGTPAASSRIGPSPEVQHLRLMKLREVAKLLDVSTVTVRRRVKDASLPAVRIKGRLYFHPHEVKAYLALHATLLWVPAEA